MPPPFAAVYFDCDSTLATIEGVDELLTVLGPELSAEIVELTEQAMNGNMNASTARVSSPNSAPPPINSCGAVTPTSTALQAFAVMSSGRKSVEFADKPDLQTESAPAGRLFSVQ